MFDGFCAVTRMQKSKLKVNTFVHAVSDLSNMAVSSKGCKQWQKRMIHSMNCMALSLREKRICQKESVGFGFITL